MNKLTKQVDANYVTRKKRINIEVPSALGGIFKEIFMDDFYELSRINKKIDSGSVVFDVGANAGYFSIFVTEKIGPKVIHCFEPLPNNYELLSRNVNGSSLLKSKVRLNNMALTSPGPTFIDLYFSTNESFSPTASTIKELEQVDNVLKVPATDLEQYCKENNIKTIDLLKMDCEGAEYDIFFNLSKEFLLNIKNIYMETHDLDKAKNTLVLGGFFKSRGYKVEIFAINDHTAMLWAEL